MTCWSLRLWIVACRLVDMMLSGHWYTCDEIASAYDLTAAAVRQAACRGHWRRYTDQGRAYYLADDITAWRMRTITAREVRVARAWSAPGA